MNRHEVINDFGFAHNIKNNRNSVISNPRAYFPVTFMCVTGTGKISI